MPSSGAPVQDYDPPVFSTSQSSYSWQSPVLDNFPADDTMTFMRYISQDDPDTDLQGCAIYYQGYKLRSPRTVTILEHGQVITCTPEGRSVTSISAQNSQGSRSNIVQFVTIKDIEAYANREGLTQRWRLED